jgi:hypothetical protein
MFTDVRMNVTGKQGSRVCLMKTGETPFVVAYPEVVMVVILLPLKRAICQKPGEALIMAG